MVIKSEVQRGRSLAFKHFVRRSMKGCVLAAAVAVVTGCGVRQEQSTNPQRTSISEPLQLEQRGVDQVDIVNVIDPEGRRINLAGLDCATAEENTRARNKDVRRAATLQQMECALQAFKTYSVGYADFVAGAASGGDARYSRIGDSVALAIRRNEIQDRMLVRSDALCRDFQRRLNIDLRIDNDTNLSNFMRNNQTRLVNGVGGLLLGGDMLWALTNAARITDLPGYVHDEGQIEKMTLRLALNGIALQRDALFREIDRRRRIPVRHGGLPVSGEENTGLGLTPVTVYSLERALGDALEYHNSCAVSTGLTYAADLVSSRGDAAGAVRDFPELMPSTVN